jgi:molybdenum cofactor cytidylyltransferase
VKIAGLLLAAGGSTRFGSDKRRAVLNDGSSLISASLLKLEAVVDRVFVAVREPVLEIAPLFDCTAVSVVQVPDTQGLGDSLAAAVRQLITFDDFDAVIIALADMPWIDVDTLKRIVSSLETNPLVVPSFYGQWGHPVGFGRRHFTELMACCGDRGARWILERNKGELCVLEVGDQGVVKDVDYPEDLHRQ